MPRVQGVSERAIFISAPSGERREGGDARRGNLARRESGRTAERRWKLELAMISSALRDISHNRHRAEGVVIFGANRRSILARAILSPTYAAKSPVPLARRVVRDFRNTLCTLTTSAPSGAEVEVDPVRSNDAVVCNQATAACAFDLRNRKRGSAQRGSRFCAERRNTA